MPSWQRQQVGGVPVVVLVEVAATAAAANVAGLLPALQALAAGELLQEAAAPLDVAGGAGAEMVSLAGAGAVAADSNRAVQGWLI
jgi:hypothetical protein